MIVSSSLYALFALTCIKGGQWIEQKVRESKNKKK